jgi:hypothetical protein
VIYQIDLKSVLRVKPVSSKSYFTGMALPNNFRQTLKSANVRYYGERRFR